MKFSHKFVDFIPDVIDDGVIYISLKYKSVIHNCACGCGKEVNTPLHPTSWDLNYNGESVSLNPSIGNWSYDCRSHYWIRNNLVEWSYDFSDIEVNNIRNLQESERLNYFKEKNSKLKEVVSPKSFQKKKRKWYSFLFFWLN